MRRCKTDRWLLSAALCTLGLVVWQVLALSAGGPDAKRDAVPNKAAQAKADALVKDIFKEDLEKAKDSADKLRLANYLLQQARESKDEPANRYILSRYARDLAAEAGDITLALTIIDDMARGFDVNALDMKVQAVSTAAANAATPESSKALVELCLSLMSDALDADNYNVAVQLGKVAEVAARKAKSVPLVGTVQKRNEEVRAVQQSFSRLQGYVDRLKENPKDTEANLEMGKYYALLKGKWAKGLPLLALGSDAAFKAQAGKDLANPDEAKQQLTVADGWWELAANEKVPAQQHLRERAAYWYDKAAVNLTGLNRTKALRRSDQVRASTVATSIAGVPLGPVGEIRKLEGHTKEVKAVAFAADGRLGASGGGDQDDTVKVWDLTTGKEVRTLKGHSKQVWGVAFHPNGRQIVSTSWDMTARLWDIKTGDEVRRYTHPIDVNGVAVSRDGKFLLTGCDDQNMRLWDVATGQDMRKYTGSTRFVYGVAFAPDGKHVACGGVDQTARVYDLTSGQQVRLLSGHANAVTVVLFSPDSKHLFTCGDTAAHQWDVSTGKEVRRFEGEAGRYILGMALSHDGRRLLTGGEDRVLRLWDVDTGKELRRFEGHSDTINSVAMSADGRHALTGSMDRTVRLWGLPAR